MAKFKNYLFIGDIDMKGVEGLHNLVVEYKKDFFTNNDLQDVLLHGGYEPEGERPTSFHDIYDAFLLRTKTSIHLGILEKMIETATNPKLTIVKRDEEGIVSPEGRGVIYPHNKIMHVALETPEGYNAHKVEEIQEKWFNESEVVGNARNFQSNLNKAFNEFNLKCVLARMHRSLSLFIPEDFGEVHNIQEKIIKYFGEKYGDIPGERLNALDNAYYNVGKMFFGQAGQDWEKLSQSDFGRMFILSPEKNKKATKKVLSTLRT